MRDLGRFTLLASAIAGRSLEVAPVERGAAAWTDGATVFVAGDAEPLEQLRSLAVQAALLGAGSLDAKILSALVRRPAWARRYLAVEGHRALVELEPLLPTSMGSLIHRATAARSDSPAASLAIAKSREVVGDPLPAFGAIRPRAARPLPAPPAMEEESEAHVPRRKSARPLRDADDGEDGEDGAAGGLDLFSSPIGGGGVIGCLLKKLVGDARSAGSGPPGADAPTHWSRRGARVARATALSTASASMADGTLVFEPRGATYPEWDAYRRRYRLDWCTVHEVDPRPEDLVPFSPPDTRALRRPLAHLGTDLERRHRQLQGDDIDIDAAVEARVETLAATAPDEALYIDSVRCHRDLAVFVLLDVSGSAGKPSASGTTVHEHQRDAAAALTVALHELGDRVALYGFRSQGRTRVEVVPVKRFGDEPDAHAMRRLGGLVPGAYTRVGAAIRHATMVVERDGGTSRRLLVVLSDGFAYDHGYQGPYGEADSRRALAEARRRGTGCVCISIGADTDARALQRVFGTAAHATIPTTNQLAGVVGPLFRSALRSAQVQRRAFQRKERTRGRLDLERKTA